MQLLGSMEASDWEDLAFLLDSAGVPADRAMGLEGDGEDGGVPDVTPEEFKNNLKVTVDGEEFEFLLPSFEDFEIWGVDNIKPPELITPPPFLDVRKLCDPVEITPEMEKEAEDLAEHFEAMGLDKTSERSSEQNREEIFTFSKICSERSATPELVLMKTDSHGNSSKAMGSGIQQASSKIIKPARKDTTSVFKVKKSVKATAPGEKSPLRVHSPSKNRDSPVLGLSSRFLPGISCEKRSNRPSVRITSKDKKKLAGSSYAKPVTKAPESSSTKSKQVSIGRLTQTQQDTTTTTTTTTARSAPNISARRPMKRPREETTKNEVVSEDQVIEIIDSSDEAA